MIKTTMFDALVLTARLGEIGQEKRLIESQCLLDRGSKDGRKYIRNDGKITHLIIHKGDDGIFTGWELRCFEDEVDEATTNGINLYPERSEKYPDPAVMGASLMEWMLAAGGI